MSDQSQGNPPQGYPQQQGVPQGYPPPEAGPQGYPPQGFGQAGPQGYPPQGFGQAAPQGYPPQGFGQAAPQAYPPQGFGQGTPQGFGGGAAGAPAGPPPRRRVVWPWLVAGAGVLAVAIVAAFVLPPLLAGGRDEVVAEPTAEPTAVDSAPPTSTTAATPTPEASGTDDITAALAERDAFFAAQQQPMDGSELSPKTPEQTQFIQDQTAWVQKQGGTVTSQAVSIWLALALDGCETAILNSHEVDATTFSMHVTTSPLISQLVSGSTNPDAERNLAQTMVFGMGYICPADGEQWSDLWDQAYG